MIKEFVSSTIKEAIVSYITWTLLVITFVGISIFGINYYWNSKKEEAVQAVKTTSTNAYHAVVDHNLTKQVSETVHNTYNRVSGFVYSKKDSE